MRTYIDPTQVHLNKCPPSPGGADDDNMNPNLPLYAPGGSCDASQIDFCNILPGFCDKPDDSDPPPSERSLIIRGSDEQKFISVNGVGMRVIFLAYPALREYLGLNGSLPGRILWRFWRFLTRECREDTIETGDIPVVNVDEEDPDLPMDILLEVEHIIDVSTHSPYLHPELTLIQRQIILRWARDVAAGLLPSGADANLDAIPTSFLKTRGPWESEFDGLRTAPAASPGGPQHAIPNDRVT